MGDKGASINASLKIQQDERLNKKHIQTLGYVQELMKENKELRQLLEEYQQQKLHCDELHAENDAAKAKIKMVQEQSLSRADEINASLVKRHEQEQNQLKEEKLNAERRLEVMTKDMALEIERLQKLNSSLEEALKAKADLTANQLEMREKAGQYQQQVDNMQQQVRSLTEANTNQLKEIKRLDLEVSGQRTLKEQLGSANQTIRELEGLKKQLESDLASSHSSLAALQDNEVKSYKNKLMKALNEVSTLQHLLHAKDSEISKSKENAEAFMEELETVQMKRFSLEREVEALKREVAELKEALAKHRGKGEDSGTFKEFVAVKRELSALQEENNFLKERLQSAAKNSPSVGKQTSKQKITLLLR